MQDLMSVERKAISIQETRIQLGYPDVPYPEVRDWDTLLASGYQAVDYTSDKVKRLFPDWNNPRPATVWARAVGLSMDKHVLRMDPVTRLPLNPTGGTGITGYGGLWHLGPNRSADLACLREDKVLMVQKRKSGLWALPGGFCDELSLGREETPSFTAVRETYEETGILAQGLPVKGFHAEVVEWSLRATDINWIENYAYSVSMDEADSSRLWLRPDRDEVRDVGWVPLAEAAELPMGDTHKANIVRLSELMVKAA